MSQTQERDGSADAGSGSDGKIYSVVTYGARTDRKRAIDLWARCWSAALGGRRDLSEKFDWYYSDNPGGDVIVSELRTADEAIGMSVEIPRRFLLNGKPVTGGAVIDFVVNPRFRSFYPAKLLQRVAQEAILERHAFLFGIPNERATRFFQKAKMGLHEVGRPHMTTVLRTTTYLRRYLKGWLAAPAGVVLDALIRCRDSVARLLLPALRGEMQAGFDERFDGLWQRTNLPGCIGVRDRQFLTWRFQNQPGRRHSVLAVTRPDQREELRAYFVMEVEDDVMAVRDVLASGSWAEQASAWFQLRRTARQMGIRTITCHIACSSRARRAMEAAGFRERGHRILFHRGLPDAEFSESRRTSFWHVTEADEDI